MNPLLRTVTTYARALATTLKSPQVRSQLQALMRSAEMTTLITTLSDTACGVTATPTDPAPPPLSERPTPDDPAPGPAMTGRARRRARAKQEPGAI